MLFLRSIVRGRLWDELGASRRSSIPLEACLCHLERSFILKGLVGRHFHSISRNGLVLLLSPRPMDELHDLQLKLRLSIWHRSQLPHELATACGILLFAQASTARHSLNGEPPTFLTTLERSHATAAVLSIELGGAHVLNFLSRV